MGNCIERALTLGYDEMCFTEHIDYGCSTSFCCNCENYYKTFLEYKKFYSEKIKLKFGIEFGAQAHHAEYFRNIFNSYPFDFVLLSFHQVQDKELWNQDFQTGKTQDEYNRIYFEEMFKTASVMDEFSVLAHIDLMRRYDRQGEYPFSKIKPQVEEILKLIINKGKGIEVNTSSFRYKLSDLTPSMDILKLYKELGGEIITIGSDSHRKEHLGSHILEVRKTLCDMGYKYFTTFDKMEPIFNKL